FTTNDKHACHRGSPFAGRKKAVDDRLPQAAAAQPQDATGLEHGFQVIDLGLVGGKQDAALALEPGFAAHGGVPHNTLAGGAVTNVETHSWSFLLRDVRKWPMIDHQ